MVKETEGPDFTILKNTIPSRVFSGLMDWTTVNEISKKMAEIDGKEHSPNQRVHEYFRMFKEYGWVKEKDSYQETTRTRNGKPHKFKLSVKKFKIDIKAVIKDYMKVCAKRHSRDKKVEKTLKGHYDKREKWINHILSNPDTEKWFFSIDFENSYFTSIHEVITWFFDNIYLYSGLLFVIKDASHVFPEKSEACKYYIETREKPLDNLLDDKDLFSFDVAKRLYYLWVQDDKKRDKMERAIVGHFPDGVKWVICHILSALDIFTDQILEPYISPSMKVHRRTMINFMEEFPDHSFFKYGPYKKKIHKEYQEQKKQSSPKRSGKK